MSSFKVIVFLSFLGVLAGCVDVKALRDPVTITAQELTNVFLREGFPRSAIKLGDFNYICMTKAAVSRKLLTIDIQQGFYKEDINDCNSYTLRMAAAFTGHGEAFGEIWGMIDGAKHALCIWVDRQHRVHFVEPQTGSHITPESVSQVVLVKMG